MKKRLSGLLALCMVCMVLLAVPFGGALAASEYAVVDDFYDFAERDIIVTAGDVFAARFTGGFVVYNAQDGQILDTDGEEPEGIVYRNGVPVNGLYCFAKYQRVNDVSDVGIPSEYVVPALTGSTDQYKVVNVEESQYNVWVDQQTDPVYFIYLEPLFGEPDVAEPVAAPSTGDGASLWLWSGLLLLSMAGMLLLRNRRKTYV